MKNSSWGVTNAPLSISAVTPAPDANGTSQSPQQQQLLLLLQDQARVVGLVLTLGSFIIFAIAGNILVILSVFCNRHLRTVTNYFIANLALADLLLSTTVLPFSAALEVMGYWAFGRPFCDVWAAVDVLCCSASIMSLCVISVDRYVGVGYPLRYPAIMTERRALFVLVSVWVLSIVISVGPLLGWKEPPPDDETICSITEEPGYALFSSMLSFYIPMCVILGMYCKVYTAAKRQTESLKAGVKRARANMREVTLRIHRGRDDGSAKEPHHLRGSLSVRILKFSREKKAAKTVGIVVGVFVLCWFPFFLVLPLARSSSAPSSTSCAVGAVRSTTVPPGGATAPSVAGRPPPLPARPTTAAGPRSAPPTPRGRRAAFTRGESQSPTTSSQTSARPNGRGAPTAINRAVAPTTFRQLFTWSQRRVPSASWMIFTRHASAVPVTFPIAIGIRAPPLLQGQSCEVFCSG
ncbi:alpha-1A adrenergic receptor-like isoform X2 [Lethenteron reissneri]|uniref:alpha-1A adrenergic receptor-like isoform X2 n=1 Tax=Lethenteron reissneri TaxID=7753 RepID=UPI002AB6ACD7|nr:alpha-1A adrenergic receptor-like isoform X2 [Lethenteron reissneri]